MYIAYFYDKNNQIVAQIENIQELETAEKINAVGTITFTVKSEQMLSQEYFKDLKKTAYNLCLITKQSETGDEKIATIGVVVGYDGDSDFKRVALKTLIHLAERRELGADVTYNNGTKYSDVLTGIVNIINTYYDSKISIECRTDATISESVEYKY